MLSGRSDIKVYCEVSQHFCLPSAVTKFGAHMPSLYWVTFYEYYLAIVLNVTIL